MRKKFILSLLALILCTTVFAADKPTVYILATGGTIAGSGASAVGSSYSAGELMVETLIQSVPQLSDIANIKGEQVAKIGSQDMTDDIMLLLAKRINTLLAQDDVDAVVVTHGTDTMEETAYFLTLTVKSPKPVILVGSMRPSTALSADGEANLYNAVVVATSKKSQNKGVMVVMNEKIYDAKFVTKTNTSSVETFASPNTGAIGYVRNNNTEFLNTANYKHTTASVFDISNITKLPKVGIVYGHSSVENIMVEALLKSSYKGIVIAGVGNGNIHKNMLPSLLNAVQNGVKVVRSSRTPNGSTSLYGEVDDAKYGFIASLWLNPQKARILLMLSLLNTTDTYQIQEYFKEY